MRTFTFVLVAMEIAIPPALADGRPVHDSRAHCSFVLPAEWVALAGTDVEAGSVDSGTEVTQVLVTDDGDAFGSVTIDRSPMLSPRSEIEVGAAFRNVVNGVRRKLPDVTIVDVKDIRSLEPQQAVIEPGKRRALIRFNTSVPQFGDAHGLMLLAFTSNSLISLSCVTASQERLLARCWPLIDSFGVDPSHEWTPSHARQDSGRLHFLVVTTTAVLLPLALALIPAFGSMRRWYTRRKFLSQMPSRLLSARSLSETAIRGRRDAVEAREYGRVVDKGGLQASVQHAFTLVQADPVSLKKKADRAATRHLVFRILLGFFFTVSMLGSLANRDEQEPLRSHEANYHYQTGRALVPLVMMLATLACAALSKRSAQRWAEAASRAAARSFQSSESTLRAVQATRARFALYLRGFEEERTALHSFSSIPPGPKDVGRATRRIEAEIVDELQQVSLRVFCIADPSDAVALPGAIRVRADADHWLSDVIEMAEDATIVVVYASSSSVGLLAELEVLRRCALLAKTVVILSRSSRNEMASVVRDFPIVIVGPSALLPFAWFKRRLQEAISRARKGETVRRPE